MLDPITTIGLAASAQQLAAAAVTVVTNLFMYFQHVHDADSHAIYLRQELMSLADVLHDAQNLFENHPARLKRGIILNVFKDVRALMLNLLERTTPRQTSEV
jgi:hypothetical protein